MLTGSLTKWAAPCQAGPCQAQAETEVGLDLAMLLLGVLKSCAFTTHRQACTHTRAHAYTHTWSHCSLYVCVRMFPRMFWLLLTKQGILLGKLHLSKSPAVILTNEPWKSEEVCVLMFVQPCICVCGFTPVYFYSSTGTYYKDDTQMAGVHVVLAFLQKQLACRSLIDTDQKMDQRSGKKNLFLFPEVIRETLLKIWICTSRLTWCWVLFKVTLTT